MDTTAYLKRDLESISDSLLPRESVKKLVIEQTDDLAQDGTDARLSSVNYLLMTCADNDFDFPPPFSAQKPLFPANNANANTADDDFSDRAMDFNDQQAPTAMSNSEKSADPASDDSTKSSDTAAADVTAADPTRANRNRRKVAHSADYAHSPNFAISPKFAVSPKTAASDELVMHSDASLAHDRLQSTFSLDFCFAA